MAEPGYDFTKRTAERIVSAVREVESRPRPRLDHKPPVHFGEPIPVWIRNEGPSASDVIPPYGVAAVVGTTFFQGFPLLLVEKPSSDFRKAYVANGPQQLAQNDHGLGYFGTVTVLYSTPPTTALEGYGPKAGSYLLDKHYPQTSESLGIVNSSAVTGSSTGPTMHATLHPIRELLVKATSPIAASSDGTAEVLFGAAPSETTSGWRINVKTLTGQSFTSDQEFVVHDVDGQWYPLGAGADVKLAVDSSNVGMHASTLLSPWNEIAQYEVNKDFEVESEAQGTTPNQSVRQFIDSNAYPGYQAGVQQNLGKDSADAIQWTTLGAAAADEKLAASSENSGVYWNQLHDPNDVNATSAFNSTGDFRVESEIFGTTPNQTIKLFVDVSDIANWTGAGHQFFMTGGTADIVLRNANNINVTTVYNSTQDFLVEPELDGSNLIFMIDNSAIPGWVAGVQQFLHHDSSAALSWTSAAGTDEKLAATSENNGLYWSGLHADVNGTSVFASGKDLVVESEIFGTTPNQTIKLFVEGSDISGFSAGAFQYLTKDTSDFIAWTTLPASTGPDEKLAASSENNGVYWNAFHADINATTVYNSTQDLRVETEIFGTTPNQTIKLFVDASDIAGWLATARQFLHHTSNGALEWISATTVCT